MKKLNAKGFTLIELLAVITIMGILMVVAIPAVSRTIENTRRDSFLDTAKQYASGVKTMWISDSLECQTSIGGTVYTVASALPDGDYYVRIDTTKTTGTGSGTEWPIILESGGKSSWGNKNVKGFVRINVSGSGTGTMKQTYYVALSDGTHGTDDSDIEYLQLKRGNIDTSGVTYSTVYGENMHSERKMCKEV